MWLSLGGKPQTSHRDSLYTREAIEKLEKKNDAGAGRQGKGNGEELDPAELTR